MNPVVFSRQRDTWETPPALLEQYGPFDLDVAASAETAKAPVWFGPDHPDPTLRDALDLGGLWARYGQRAWLNPPYSQIAAFLDRATREVQIAPGFELVCLLPARTDTRWWHTHIWLGSASRHRVEVEFLRGRLKFSGSANSAPFPSVVVTFR